MTRFWITLHDGVKFVRSCLERAKGGEVFVPKIPSSTIEALAKALCPDCKIDVVGIRPGEKLHETLIPQDETRNTLEFDDCYVIQPAFQWWDSAAYIEDGIGKKVGSDFCYRSDRNVQTLDSKALRALLDKYEITSKHSLHKT